uniref:Derlin n=1 Tax=Suricata suricatta TaxID=37032 RepID=A0A673U4Q5_SURSU
MLLCLIVSLCSLILFSFFIFFPLLFNLICFHYSSDWYVLLSFFVILACYLPWVILGFNYIIGGSVINELIGNLVGHLYFFLMFTYPMDLGGRNFLSTPQFLYRWLPSRRGGVSGFGVPPASVRRAADQNGGGRRHNWGQGFWLGDQ